MSHNTKDEFHDEFDEILKENFKEHYANLPGPKYSEDYMWKILQRKLAANYERQQKRHKRARYSSIISIAAVLVLIVAIATPQSGGAIDRIANMYYTIQDSTLSLFLSSGDHNENHNNNAQIARRNHEEKLLIEASKQVDFQILAPSYVPSGFKLNDAAVNEKEDQTTLNYVHDDKVIDIVQQEYDKQFLMSWKMSENEAQLTTAIINTYEVYIIEHKDKVIEARWLSESFYHQVQGTVAQVELIKMIQSMYD